MYGVANVTNNGAITVNNTPGVPSRSAGIFGTDTVINTGSISLSGTGGWGIYTALDVLNTGSISDTPGTGAIGVVVSRSLDNRGTISVDGDAVEGGQMVTNSGTIESRLGTAIQASPGGILVNEAGGTISGAIAVNLDNGLTIVNRGAIVGDITSNGNPYSSSAYIANGGTLSGNLSLGANDDLFLQYGADSGVTGTIDGGAGIDTAGFIIDQDATVIIAGGLPTNFENAFVYVGASDAVATLDASAPLTGDLYVGGSGAIVNTASVNGAVFTQTPGGFPGLLPATTSLTAFDNRADIARGVSGTIETLTNSGRIVTDVAYATALALDLSGGATPIAATITNSGTIGFDVPGYANPFIYGVRLNSTVATSATLTNEVGGIIRGGGVSVAISASNVALTINNAGTIEGGAPGSPGRYIGAAVSIGGSLANTIVNTGTIDGSILLGAGDDRVENRGTLTAPVVMGGGNDTFVLRGAGNLGALVDGGAGTNAFIVDATGNGSLVAGQFFNFASLTQIGADTFSYSGSFAVPTIALESGTLAVAAGTTLATSAATTITGGNGGAIIDNAGTIAGNVSLGSGTDAVINSGMIQGVVNLGGGDDSYTEASGSSVASVDGGAGIDTYRVRLAGDRTGVGARANFEQLAVDGTGALTLALDQDYQEVALAGTGLNATLAGYTIGRIGGSAGSEQVVLDGDVAAVALGGGDDSLTLTLPTLTAAGVYDGGAGLDTLVFNASGPITLAGTIAGFESVTLPGNALTVTGTLGRAGETLNLGSAAQSLTIGNGATLAGTVDLGDGDDSFRLASGGTRAGTVIGGAGNDTAIVETTSAVTLANGALIGFEQFATQGSGLLTLVGGDFSFDTASIEGDLTIAAGASLAAQMLTFGPADNTLTIAGGFAGSVDGSAGNDTIAISGGSAASPVAFGSIAGVEALRMSAGLATIAGSATFSDITLTGGRLIGLAGSTIAAPTIGVGAAATFGSAGTVTGNINVAGTLSPGASPGTMTVNGNVSLGAGSVSLFEITPAVSDKLVVNGTVAIAQGATLQIVAGQSLTPGQSLDLVVASGGITGSYTNFVKPAALFGFLVQDANRIALLGQFLNDTSYTPQVQGSIAYVNSVLTSGQASAALLTAVPQLASASGVANAAAFAQLTPEPYASATQLTYETGLALAQAGRGSAFASTGDEPRAYTFASVLAGTRTLKGGNAGTARADINGYGVLGGIGWGSSAYSIGAFVGYSNGHEDLDDLGARTEADGIVAGLHSRWSGGGFGLKATIAYDGGSATTRRVVPGGTTSGTYDLHGWMADVSADYALALGDAWELRPSVGVTAIRVTREALSETSIGAYRLDVAEKRDHATFIDGGLTLVGGQDQGATLRPFLSLGMRQQVEGRTRYAVGALGGGGFGLVGAGAARAETLGTATIGADADLTDRFAVFGTLSGEAGDADHNARAQVGLRLEF